MLYSYSYIQQEWYKVHVGVLSFSLAFFGFVAILKKIHCISAVSAMALSFTKAKNTKLTDKTSS